MADQGAPEKLTDDAGDGEPALTPASHFETKDPRPFGAPLSFGSVFNNSLWKFKKWRQLAMFSNRGIKYSIPESIK
ncbi:hypothetical protein [Paraburkholderia dilworthii]|uniref:Uncharacterized protein n=1 Tax=Paraburkholderia dilworthii TaxID=948106 RepID=A0ABW9DB76_9BURK